MTHPTRTPMHVKELTLELGQDCADVMTVFTARDFFVDVLYTGAAGAAAKLSGAMEDSVEAMPAELNIAAVLIKEDHVWFDAAPNDEAADGTVRLCRGFNLLPMLSTDLVERMADNFLATKTWSLSAE
jgi:hypothetical protein